MLCVDFGNVDGFGQLKSLHESTLPSLQYQPEHQLHAWYTREIMSPFSKYRPLKKHQPIDGGIVEYKVLRGAGDLRLEVEPGLSLGGVLDVLVVVAG